MKFLNQKEAATISLCFYLCKPFVEPGCIVSRLTISISTQPQLTQSFNFNHVKSKNESSKKEKRIGTHVAKKKKAKVSFCNFSS